MKFDNIKITGKQLSEKGPTQMGSVVHWVYSFPGHNAQSTVTYVPRISVTDVPGSYPSGNQQSVRPHNSSFLQNE